MPQVASPTSSLAYAHWLRGLGLKQRGELDAALLAFRDAVALEPEDGVYWLNLAHALDKRRDWNGALAAARRALLCDPDCTVACLLATDQLIRQHRFDDALAELDALHPEAPRGRDFQLRRATALLGENRAQAAVDALLAAIGDDLAHAASHHHLGIALGQLGMPEEAAEAHRTAWLLAPDRVEALELAAHRLQHACRWERFDEDCALIERAHATAAAPASLPFALLALPVAPATVRAGAAAAAADVDRLTTLNVVPRREFVRPADAKLRVGYVSNDFHQHATTQLIAEMLEHHDRSRFEVTLYSHGDDDGSAMRRRIEAACERFVEIARVGDDEAAATIAADGIDILVDLKGYTAGQRLGIFGHRPAPIQVGFLGFPGTCGGRFLDYLVGDRVTTPRELAWQYAEKIAQMPLSYQPNDSRRVRPEAVPRAACQLPDQAFVLCCFNQNYKFTPAVFGIWCALLRDLPHAVLWLLQSNETATSNMQREAERRGVDPRRLLFAPPLPLTEHLARLQAADLFLDTTPYGAHTTASDALWVGLPVVTVAGPGFASRVAASLLNTLGLPELVATDLESYARIVHTLAEDRSRLAALRARLAGSRESSGLFDGRRFARDLEALYSRMAERSRAGLAPDHLWA